MDVDIDYKETFSDYIDFNKKKDNRHPLYVHQSSLYNKTEDFLLSKYIKVVMYDNSQTIKTISTIYDDFFNLQWKLNGVNFKKHPDFKPEDDNMINFTTASEFEGLLKKILYTTTFLNYELLVTQVSGISETITTFFDNKNKNPFSEIIKHFMSNETDNINLDQFDNIHIGKTTNTGYQWLKNIMLNYKNKELKLNTNPFNPTDIKKFKNKGIEAVDKFKVGYKKLFESISIELKIDQKNYEKIQSKLREHYLITYYLINPKLPEKENDDIVHDFKDKLCGNFIVQNFKPLFDYIMKKEEKNNEPKYCEKFLNIKDGKIMNNKKTLEMQDIMNTIAGNVLNKDHGTTYHKTFKKKIHDFFTLNQQLFIQYYLFTDQNYNGLDDNEFNEYLIYTKKNHYFSFIKSSLILCNSEQIDIVYTTILEHRNIVQPYKKIFGLFLTMFSLSFSGVTLKRLTLIQSLNKIFVILLYIERLQMMTYMINKNSSDIFKNIIIDIDRMINYCIQNIKNDTYNGTLTLIYNQLYFHHNPSLSLYVDYYFDLFSTDLYKSSELYISYVDNVGKSIFKNQKFKKNGLINPFRNDTTEIQQLNTIMINIFDKFNEFDSIMKEFVKDSNDDILSMNKYLRENGKGIIEKILTIYSEDKNTTGPLNVTKIKKKIGFVGNGANLNWQGMQEEIKKNSRDIRPNINVVPSNPLFDINDPVYRGVHEIISLREVLEQMKFLRGRMKFICKNLGIETDGSTDDSNIQDLYRESVQTYNKMMKSDSSEKYNDFIKDLIIDGLVRNVDDVEMYDIRKQNFPINMAQSKHFKIFCTMLTFLKHIKELPKEIFRQFTEATFLIHHLSNSQIKNISSNEDLINFTLIETISWTANIYLFIPNVWEQNFRLENYKSDYSRFPFPQFRIFKDSNNISEYMRETYKYTTGNTDNKYVNIDDDMDVDETINPTKIKKEEKKEVEKKKEVKKVKEVKNENIDNPNKSIPPLKNPFASDDEEKDNEKKIGTNKLKKQSDDEKEIPESGSEMEYETEGQENANKQLIKKLDDTEKKLKETKDSLDDCNENLKTKSLELMQLKEEINKTQKIINDLEKEKETISNIKLNDEEAKKNIEDIQKKHNDEVNNLKEYIKQLNKKIIDIFKNRLDLLKKKNIEFNDIINKPSDGDKGSGGVKINIEIENKIDNIIYIISKTEIDKFDIINDDIIEKKIIEIENEFYDFIFVSYINQINNLKKMNDDLINEAKKNNLDVNKIEKYEKLIDEQNLQILNLRQELEKKKNEKENEINELKEQLKQLEDDYNNKSEDIDILSDLQNKITKYKSQIKEKNELLINFNNKINELNKESISNTEKHNKELEKIRNLYNIKEKMLNEKINNLNIELGQVQKGFTELWDEKEKSILLTDVIKKINEKDGYINKLIDIMNKMKIEIQNKQKTNNELNNQLQELIKQNNIKDEKINNLLQKEQNTNQLTSTLANYENNIVLLQNTIEILKKKIKEKNETIEKNNEIIDNLNKEIVDKKNKLSENDNTINNLTQNIDELNNTIQTITNESQKNKSKQDELIEKQEKDIKEKEKEKKILDGKIKEYEIKIKEYELKNSELIKLINSNNNNNIIYDDIIKKNDKLLTENLKLNEQLEKYKTLNNELTSIVTSLGLENDAMKQQINRQTDELNNIKKILNEYVNTIQKLNKVIGGNNINIENIINRITNIINQSKQTSSESLEIKKQKEELENELILIKTQKEELEKTINELKTQIKTLNENIKKITNEINLLFNNLNITSSNYTEFTDKIKQIINKFNDLTIKETNLVEVEKELKNIKEELEKEKERRENIENEKKEIEEKYKKLENDFKDITNEFIKIKNENKNIKVELYNELMDYFKKYTDYYNELTKKRKEKNKIEREDLDRIDKIVDEIKKIKKNIEQPQQQLPIDTSNSDEDVQETQVINDNNYIKNPINFRGFKKTGEIAKNLPGNFYIEFNDEDFTLIYIMNNGNKKEQKIKYTDLIYVQSEAELYLMIDKEKIKDVVDSDNAIWKDSNYFIFMTSKTIEQKQNTWESLKKTYFDKTGNANPIQFFEIKYDIKK
jgi:chromosome segregation ATPase